MARSETSAPAPMFTRHPLQLSYRRAKVSQAVIRRIFRKPGTILGEHVSNWIGGGLMATMLHNVYYSPEEEFVEARRMLKTAGIRLRPNQAYFDGLAMIEKAHPALLSREDLASGLDMSLPDVDKMIRYLRGFVMTMCGICILKTGQGDVSIATIDLWMDWQNHITRTQNGLQKAKEKNGFTEDNVKANRLRVVDNQPSYQPLMLELIPPKGKAGADSGTD